MDEVGAGDHGVGGFVFTGVVIDAGGFFGRASGAAAFTVQDVDDVIVRTIELRLSEKGKQMFVASVTVDDDDFLAAVARHLFGGFLEELQLQFHAVGNGAGFVLGFENLSEVVLRKNDGVFLLGGFQGSMANIQKIGAERQMRTVLFENAERQETGAFGLLDSGAKAGSGEFFPLGGELGLRMDGTWSNET